MGGLFDEPEGEIDDGSAAKPGDVGVQIFVKEIPKDNLELPKLRQEMVQKYRSFKENTNIARYLNLVQIFVKIATKAPYPLEMLQNVANPYHLKTLIQMLFQVSVQYKL